MKNHLVFFLAVIIVIIIFSSAAICNFCGLQLDTSTSEQLINENENGTAEKLAPDESDQAKLEETVRLTSKETEDTESNTLSNKKAPTIKLEVSEGPFYSSADDVCYWRVKAIVTGNPSPDITWSQDFSGGAFGKNIAQVNLTRDNPNYTLKASAANSEGTASNEISLTWGCGEIEPLEDEPEEDDDNHCPHISLAPVDAGYDGTLPCNMSYYFVCTGEDPDGDELSYHWDISAGTGIRTEEFEDPSRSLISFTTPATPGILILRITVSDGNCNVRDTETINIINE